MNWRVFFDSLLVMGAVFALIGGAFACGWLVLSGLQLFVPAPWAHGIAVVFWAVVYAAGRAWRMRRA